MTEAASQLYRCSAPLRPWIHYLYLIYESPDKVLGIVLFMIYGLHKGYDIISHVKLFFEAAWKMLQTVVCMILFIELENFALKYPIFMISSVLN